MVKDKNNKDINYVIFSSILTQRQLAVFVSAGTSPVISRCWQWTSIFLLLGVAYRALLSNGLSQAVV
jgi:hypothetical protein